MAERPLYTLYKNLKAQNYDVPDDYNKFESALTRDGKGGADNRHAIYENLKAQNFDVPSTYERFYSALFEPRSKTSSRAKGGSVPMTAADRARFSAGAQAISASAQQTMNNAGRYNRLKQRKQKQQKDFGRVNLGTHQTPYGGDANNVVKDDFAYNPETGKAGAYVTSDNENAYTQNDAEQKQAILDQQNNAYQQAVDTGEIPSAFDVRDKNGNYDLQENIGKNGTYLTEEGAQKQFDKKLADAYARKKEIEAAIAEDHRLHGNPLLSYGASIGGSNGRTAEQNDYSNKLATSLALVNQQIGALEAVKQYPTSSWGEDALKALDNTAFTAKTWDFGLTDFATMGQMERIKTKMDNNIPLSGSDKMLLKSKLGADAAAALEDEKMGNIYRWTKIAGQSLPFMLDFALTGGFGGITKGISRGALKFAAKRGMGKVSAAILKNTGIVAGDVIGSYAMAGTEQALKTGADIMQRHLGNLYQDEKGDYKFGTFDENGNLLHEGGESMGTALYKGLTSAMVENYTEKLFGHNYGIKKGAIAAMEKHGMNGTAQFFKNIGSSGWYTNSKKWMEKFGINGFGEEVMEEEIGIPLHALLDGDNKFSDLGDAKQQLDIIGGMAISVGSMYAMGAGSRPVKGIYNRVQYYRFRNKVNVADNDAQNLLGDNWADIKDKIDNATNEQMGSVLAGILRQRDTMTKEQINAAVNYGVNLMKMRGYNIAKTAEMNAREITNEPTTPEEQHQTDIDNAYSEGHDADDADKHDIQIQQEDQMKTLAAALGISEQQLSAMSDEELESLTGQDDKLDQAIYDYQLSSARYQGVVDDAQDKVDLAAHQAEQRVDMYTDQSRGSVRNATIKASGGLEDYGVYIISGNVATHEDGSIDVSNSDDMILYYDPTTNSVEHADAMMFAELGEELPAVDVKTQAVADAKENAIKEIAGIIDGTVEVGSQFNVTDTDGTEHSYEVLADYGDGTAAISIDGNVVENPYSLADLQQMKDMEDQKRLEAAKAQREQMEKERPAQQTQETEQTQPSFDFNQILNDNGNVVLVDVLDKDGNTKYPDSKLFLIRDAGAKAKVVELKNDGTIVPHAVNKEDVATISSMSLDEYKQAMPESSMIEDNSGEKSDEDSQLANLGLPKGSEIWMSGDGFGRPKENTLSRVVGIDEQGSIILEDKDGKKWSASFDYINNHRELPPLDENTNIVNEENNQTESNTEENTPAPEQTPAMTLEDGTEVPMLEDGNPDFSKLTAEQTAELYDTQFGEDADSVISNWVSEAKKALDKANNMAVKGKTFVEQKAAKDVKEKAIAEAQAAYDSAIAIRDAYNERQLAKVEDTAEGRKNLIDKARRKFARLKSAVKDDAEAVSQLYRDTIGSLLHRLYDSTGIDVTDTTPLTAEEYVASNLGAHSLNYEGTETSKGVKQETGLSREDFTKTQLLAADGKGTTIDALVHSLWENRPSNLESLDTQDIRNALIGVLNSGFKASEARNFVENIRIAQAENILEEQKRAQEDAAYAEQQKAEPESELKAKLDEKAELKAKSEAKLDNESDNESNDLSNEFDNEKINDKINDNINSLTPEQQKAKEDGEKLGFPAVDKEGEPINQYVIELANWAKEQGLEIDPTSKLNSYADLFLMCKDGFGVSTLVPDDGENINQVVYFPDNAEVVDQLGKLQEEFNAGRDLKHSSNIDSEITEGVTFYDADTAREFKEFVDKKVEEQNKVFGEQKSEEDLPFSAKENGKQQTTAERAADVEKNKVDDMKVVDNIVGQKTRKAFERLAKMMGASIQWQYSDKLGNGWIQETKDADGNVHRTIFITLDSSITEGAQFIFGHEMTHQIKNLNPAAYNELTQLVLDTYGADAFDKAVDETMKRYSDAGFSGRARDYYAEEVVADAVGEMIRDLNLAHTLAMKMSHPLLAAIHEILQKIKLAFYGTEYSDVTKNIIRSIEQAYVKTGGKEGEIFNGNRFSLKVYHGSGADFTEFDFDHMGEGAGSQVFGWGGYVTSSKKIGKSYANLVDTNAPHQDVKYVGNNAHEYTDVVAGLFNGGERDYDDVREFLQNGYNADKKNARKKQMLEWFESTKPSDWKSVNDGKRNLYEVDIPDDNGSNYLEWGEKPSDEVATKIIEGLYGLDAKTLDDMASKDIVFRTLLYDYIKNADKGQMIPLLVKTHALTRGTTYDNGNVEDDIRFVYTRLSNWMGSPKAASQFLSSIGYTGIKYPAGTIMGGAEEGDTNYVIFKPEDMRITEHTKFSLRLKSAIEETETNPSDAQKESGNYKKGHIKFGGYNYTIENPKGSTRSGKDADGKEWKVTMHDTYGYIRGKFGKDGDHLDMFINDKADLDNWKGDVPDEFNAPDVVANKNADNESGAEYHEYKQDEPSSITYKDRYKAFKQRMANREKTAGLRKERKEAEDSYNSKSKERIEYNKQLMKEYMDKHGLSSENDIPYDVWENLRSKSFEKYQDELDSLFNKYKDLDKQIKAVAEPRFSLKEEKTLAGVHNITEEKLRKALKLGGFANPSLAVIDTSKSGHDNFGEISFIAPSAILDKRTGKTAGTWITDAYTQRYPSVEREMSEKGYRKFEDWVASLDYPSGAKAEIERQAKDALSDNNTPAWELMYLKEKGIDIKEYDSRIDYRWKEIISDHPTAEDILNSMKTDPELKEKVTSLAKHAIIHPTWEKVSLEVRRKMYKETGVKASPINPQVRKQTKEIFERDYAPSLLNKNGTPKKSDVKKVVEQMVKEHNDTKKYDFYLSKVKASNYVNKNGLYDDYNRWQENKLDEFGTKNRIFRGYTRDGSRKYVPETLENVSMVMREEADGQTNGSEYTSFGSFIAKLASRVDSTDEMRANKDKLSSNKDKEEFYEKWNEVYYELAKFLYNDVFYGEQRLHDIVLQSDPKKYAKKEYGITLTPTFMKKLDALKNAVQTELKSAYFETKYNRPLRLNEFAAAVVPDNLGEDVRKGIENAGLPMYNYDPNKEGDRSRAFNEAINSSDNIRFSLKAEKEKIVADAKANGTYMTAPNGEKTKLDEEQWATVRTTNFKNWFGDWENDLENASKVVDENGEPMVVWHGRSAEFNTFEKKEGVRFIMGLEDKVKAEGFFFSPDKGLAEEFASNSSRHRGGKANVVPCFLNIRRPMDLTGEDYDRIYEDVTGWKYMVGMDTQDNLWGIMDEEGMADKIKEKGYDGAIFVEEVDDSYEPTKISYCALDANQIKSAENNNGDFSADNNDIRFSLKSMMAKPEGWKQANKKAIHIAEAIERDPKFSLKNLDGSLIKAGTYFSGGGLVEEGLKGIIDPVVAVEYDEKISGVYRNNFGQHIVTADVRDVDPKELVKQIDGDVEYFHASPVCKNYSQAKSNHAEVELDKETAASTAEFINAIKPNVVTIENVKGYKDSEAMKTITDALDANGYTWDADVYNAADYGGYTNRERLIVRAVRDGKLPEKPKKMAHKSGWYEAVADIIPTLTEKKNGVAPWMDIRLKADGIDWRNIDKPLYVMGSAYADGKVPHAFADELLPTLRTKSGDVIVMPDGKVYRAMGRVLARVSGVSDDYKMPFSENLSHTIIGNGIPTQLTEHVIAPLLQNTLRPTTPEDGNTRFSLRYDQFEHDLNQWKKDNNLPKDAQRPTIPQRNAGESAADFLKRVDEYRKQMALWKTAPTYEQHLLSDDTALGEFNRELQRGSVLKRIAFQDSMLAIRKAQEAIMKEVGVDRLNMAEDAYTAENRSHGKGKNEFEEYNNEFLQPLRKAYHQMKKVLGNSYDNVRVYMMAKHGLERDAQMAFKKSLEADFEDVAQRSAAYKAYKGDMNRIINDSDLEFGRVDFTTWRQRDNALRVKYSPSYMDYRYDKNGIAYDYSGLSAIFDGSDFEEAAYKLVKDIEDKYVTETHNLWDATNAATKKILRDGYKAGMMSKDAYQYVRDMYSHYIPLRGWDGTTADQVWDYIGGGKGAFNQTLKTAHGRTSIADDPIAYIENMAESGILLNNKNWVKQHLMLLAQNHPTSLLTLSKAWYVKSTDANGNEEWIPATPQITSQMDSNQVKAAIDAFEKKMEKMTQTGDATQKRDGLNIAYPQTHSEEREHEVRVMKDGEEYVIYVNGDPQLAQAMNNTRAHRVREIQSGKLDRAAAWLGRKMAAAYTSLSPLFIPSNYFRDLTMTLASTAIREDAKYNYLLRKNLATSWNLGFMLRDYQNGKLRDKVNNGNATPKEQMFYDFMMNGGETGFVSSLDVEDLKKKFKNDLKDLDRWKTNPVKVGHTIMDGIEFLNRMIEDSNRFAVYMTSIQYGRSIDEAVNDAKDVTLNFNRKGTGEYGWQMIRNLYLFINPAVQSLQTLGALVKHHPFKFTAVTASWLASGVLVPIVNAALMSLCDVIASAFGGDDDKEKYISMKDKYWQFTKWDRRNNLIMYFPFSHEFVKIPLAQEFRAFYGVGDMIASKMMGGELAEESWSQYAEDLLGQVVDMLPLDPTGYDGNIAVSLMPNAIRPVFELAFNVDFTGKPLFKETEYNKYDPNFTKAYVGTPDWLVRASRMVNSIGNDYPDVQQNSIDAFGDPKYNLNNPAVVDHVLSSYLGGAYTMGSQVLGVLTKSLNDPKEIKVADIPLVSKFVSNPDDRPVTKKQGDEFWNMKENHDRAANTLSKLKKQAKVDGDYSMLERFYGSEEYKQYKQDDVKVKKYEEDKKKERAEESGEEYRPHKLNAEDIYKAHATPKDDFEDLKLKQLYTKLNGFKTAYDLLVDTAPSQSDGYYNTNKAAIDAIDDISIDKQEISELKKGFLDDGKDAYNAEDMKQIRDLRKKILAVLEKANKVIVANQKVKAKK